eukprot:gene688-biopygen5190
MKQSTTKYYFRGVIEAPPRGTRTSGSSRATTPRQCGAPRLAAAAPSRRACGQRLGGTASLLRQLATFHPIPLRSTALQRAAPARNPPTLTTTRYVPSHSTTPHRPSTRSPRLRSGTSPGAGAAPRDEGPRRGAPRRGGGGPPRARGGPPPAPARADGPPARRGGVHGVNVRPDARVADALAACPAPLPCSAVAAFGGRELAPGELLADAGVGAEAAVDVVRGWQLIWSTAEGGGREPAETVPDLRRGLRVEGRWGVVEWDGT